MAKAIGGLFLWPDPASCLAPGFPRLHALWSADFPLSRVVSSTSGHPADLGIFIIPSSWRCVNIPDNVSKDCLVHTSAAEPAQIKGYVGISEGLESVNNLLTVLKQEWKIIRFHFDTGDAVVMADAQLTQPQ